MFTRTLFPTSDVKYKNNMNEPQIYEQLVKPFWSPPSWLFGPVWTVLYAIIVISFGTVFYKTYKGKITRLTALPFLLNLIFNFAFTPIQFGLKNNLLASGDILLVLGTLIWGLTALWKTSRELCWVVYVNIPYLIWTTFATCLQLTITYLNF